MGNKRLRLAQGVGKKVVPMSVNFSELQKEMDDDEVSYTPSDNGMEERRLEGTLDYEELVVQILCNLEERERLIFVYQLLRDNGFQIDHTAFAKTIHISRRQYMRLLEVVRTKSMLFMYARKERERMSRGTNSSQKT